MIKRIIAFGIAFAMIICAGCSNEGSKKVQLPDGSGASDSQYVLAMNPAVILPDGQKREVLLEEHYDEDGSRYFTGRFQKDDPGR